jgi:signal recognition particle subunit SRP19
MSHARVEEVSDSDTGSDLGSDPDIMDPGALIVPNHPAPARREPESNPTLLRPTAVPTFSQGPTVSAAEVKSWVCLYPLYFDASRTKAEGRRVGKELAVQNPLATNIVEAVAALGLTARLEPDKMHPKDWGNPGRVRVDLESAANGGRRPPVTVSNSEL